MSQWNKTDAESSKPNWLTDQQRRVCVRTIRGWEIPLVGCGTTGTTSNQFNNSFVTSSATNVVPMELLVAISLTSGESNYTTRGLTMGVPGASATNATLNYNYAPYFTQPNQGKVIRIPRGVTAYIPVITADYNSTELPWANNIVLSNNPTAGNISFTTSITGSLTGTIGASAWNLNSGLTASYAPYGGWSGITFGAGVLTINAGLTGGTYGCTASVNDRRSSGSLTGTTFFQIVVV